MREIMQGPGSSPAQAAPRTAEEVQIDRRLELESKKAALRELEAENGTSGAQDAGDATPAPASGARIVTISKDGQTIVLENPTNAQLEQAGVTAAAPVDKETLVTLGSGALVAVVLVTWMVLQFLKRGRSAHPTRPHAETDARIERIEHAVESIAVEVERISEGQRFASRLLAEGAAQPVVGAVRAERVMHDNGEG